MHKQSIGFKLINYLFFSLIGLLTLYPLWDVMAGSLMYFNEYASKIIRIIPENPTLQAYTALFNDHDVWTPIKNTVFVTVVGTILSILVTSMGAYSLSRGQLVARNTIMLLITFTMLFGGGLVPLYMIVRELNLIDSLWALIIIPLVNTFYLIIMRTFFRQIPESMEEAAKIDGANDILIFFRIMLPLSMPMLATMILFVSVDRWNDLFTGLVFINSPQNDVLQVMLYRMISNTMNNPATQTGAAYMMNVAPATQRMAAVVITTLPVLVVYPFLQKYFVNGVMLGSVKG